MTDNSTIKSIVDAEVARVRQQLKAEYETKFTQAMSQVRELEAQLRDAKADLLDLERRAQSERDANIRGRGQMFTDNTHGLTNTSTLTKADYAAMLPAKLGEHSLEEILQMQAIAAGVNPDVNSEAFAEFHGISERQIAAREARRARE